MDNFSKNLSDFHPVELPNGLSPDYTVHDLLADLLRKVGRTGQRTAQSMDLMRSDFEAALKELQGESEKNRLAAVGMEADLKSLENGLLDFMDILDNLQRAAESIKDQKFIDAVSVAGQAKVQIMERMGIQMVPAVGSTFSNDVHYVSDVEIVNNKNQDEKVLQVIEIGYRRGSRLLRKATVVCGKFEGDQ